MNNALSPGDKGQMLKRLRGSIQGGQVVARRDILFEICRCIASAVKARDFSLYIISDENVLKKYEQGSNKE